MMGFNSDRDKWAEAIEVAMSKSKLEVTGINGWVNLDLFEVHFTPRCNHTTFLEEVHYYDGSVGCGLSGVVGNYFDQYEDGGAGVNGNMPDLYDTYSWAANKFGWRQFISLVQFRDGFKSPKLQIFGQHHVQGKAFASVIGAETFKFKDDYVWP